MKFRMKMRSGSRERRPTNGSLGSTMSSRSSSLVVGERDQVSPSPSSSIHNNNNSNNISHQSMGRDGLDSANNSISANESSGLLHSSTASTSSSRFFSTTSTTNTSGAQLSAGSKQQQHDDRHVSKRSSCGLLHSLKLGVEQSRAFSINDDDGDSPIDGDPSSAIKSPSSSSLYLEQQHQKLSPNGCRLQPITNSQQQRQHLNSVTASDNQSSSRADRGNSEDRNSGNNKNNGNNNGVTGNDSRRESSTTALGSQRQVSPSSSTSRSIQSSSRPSSRQQQRRRQFQKAASLDSVHVVVGNEACDLDSAVSCLIMFHILNKTAADFATGESSKSNGQPRTLFIPLLNVERRRLETKTEVLWYLKKTLNIDKSHLTCKDDIDWNEIKKMGIEVLVTLVDHNHNEEFANIGRIVEIIDHHQIQNRDQLVANHANVRLTLDPTVGSCTTLLAERLFYVYAEHHVSDEILMLIYGTILLDTICLSERARRFTRRDVYLLDKIDSLLIPAKRPSRQELYKSLVEVKNCCAKEMSFESLLTRDLKVFQEPPNASSQDSNDPLIRVAVASLFGVAAQEALGLAANSVDLDVFFDLHKCQAFVIMGLITDLANPDSISRDLVVLSRQRRLFDNITSALESVDSKLDLAIIKTNPEDHPDHKHLSITFDDDDDYRHDDDDYDEDDSANESRSLNETETTHTDRRSIGRIVVRESRFWARLYNQRNVSASRKVVAPIVVKVLHDRQYRFPEPGPSSPSTTTNLNATDSGTLAPSETNRDLSSIDNSHDKQEVDSPDVHADTKDVSI